MIFLNGVNLVGTELSELHEFARKMGVSKSWWRTEDECYDILCPFKVSQIRKRIENREKLHNKNKKQQL